MLSCESPINFEEEITDANLPTTVELVASTEAFACRKHTLSRGVKDRVGGLMDSDWVGIRPRKELFEAETPFASLINP